ncbi:MAG TPA: class I SAM-dependent methyltransferase, partial [Ferruginibacter sp.]|nr:class I SAM-dependent methyltransferase [Ferruginibacter sp.]
MDISTACKVCGNTENNKLYQVKEMQLGLREMFPYMECGSCGCMQLLEIPADLGKYYPNEGYYSFNLGLDVKKKPDALRKLKASYLMYGKNKLLGSLLSIGYKTPDYYSWMKQVGVQYDDAILDVGTGNGSLLLSLFKIGYTNLTGIDPFIDKDHQYGPINIYKKDIFALEGQFDYIMLHHAFEHMDEPLKVLQQLYKLLKPERYLLIRTPVMGMYSWHKYGVNWMDLDAPRHIIIHSLKSMELLAKQAGFELRKIIFDGNYMSLIGSDQYSKDIALPDPNSHMVNKEAAGYTKEDIENFKAINAK